MTVSAGALFIHISEYENSYWSDVGYDIETPGLILDPEIVEYLSFVATSDREYEYGYGLNDYSFYEMYLGDELWRRYIHDPNSDDPEDLIQYGQHIQHQWDGQKCVYYPGAYLPEATRGGTFQILLHASNWNHVSVVLTYEALPASTPESDIQFELNPVYFESFRNYTVVD